MERPHGTLTSSDAPLGAAARDNAPAAGTAEDVEQLKTEIHETQVELQQTVAAIQERLSPAHLKEQAASTVREATIGRVHQMINRAEDRVNQATESTRQVATSASREVRSNPMPYALIGAGVAWLLASRRSSTRWDRVEPMRDWPENRVRSTTSLDEESAWGGPSTSQSAFGAYGSSAESESAAAYGSSAPYGSSPASGASSTYGSGAYGSARRYGSTGSRRMQVEQLRTRWQDMLQQNPMALGVAALAAGALVGAALPTTEVENEYLGEARDTVVESAKTLAENTAQKVVEQT
jgi:ElaB/YqjD/DUF883 family membrane-anchored ribosome-binding protein